MWAGMAINIYTCLYGEDQISNRSLARKFQAPDL